MGVSKNQFFEAGKFLNPEFTTVNEEFKNDVQQRTPKGSA